MKKYLLTCIAAVSTCVGLQAQVVVQSGSSIVIKAGTTLYMGGLTLTPSADFTFTNTLNTNTTVSNPSPDPNIARVYQFANTTNAFSGTIRIHYKDAELNGLPEQNLVVGVYNSSMWQRFGASSSDAVANYVISNAISGVPLKEVTLVTPSSILPLTFLNAAAYRRTGGIQIDWKVGDQTTTSQYEVERSTDGIHFTKVYTILALRMVGSGYTYNWLDQSPPLGIIYYRVKSIGLGGSNVYSLILKVAPVNTPGNIGVSPNPMVGNTLNLQLINQEKGNYIIRMMGINGQLIFTKVITHSGGSSVQQLPLPYMTKGMYQLEIIKPGHTKEIRKMISE